jgi:hypothetical protein
MATPEPQISPTTPPTRGSHERERRRDRFLPRMLRRASVGRFYGPGGMAAAPDSPAHDAAEVRSMRADTQAKHHPDTPE